MSTCLVNPNIESGESLDDLSLLEVSRPLTDWAFLREAEKPLDPEMHIRKIHVVDLFCGCGGLSLGLRQACHELGLGFEVDWAVDSDERALAVYKKNFHPSDSSSESIEDMISGSFGATKTSKENLIGVGRLSSSIDFLLAGPPCQGHSGLNNRTRHDDERNSLYERVGRFVELFKPNHALIENVPTVVVDRSESIQKTLAHVESLGYHVSTHVVDLSIIGVPQRRKRHIVLASRTWQGDLPSIVEKYSVSEARTVRWAIADLEGNASADATLLDRPSVLSEENKKRVRYLAEHGLFNLPNAERPICHQNDDHSYKSMYGRLKWDEPAQTITTGFSSPGQGRFVHPAKQRTLTPHEAARLQFFPEFFDFSDAPNRSALAKMIGNAVPCKLTWIIALELLR